MKKKYYKTINYQQLLISTIKKKYFSLILGLIVSYFFASLFTKLIPKQIYLGFRKSNKINPFQKNPSKPFKTYTVVEGDDLWKIAEKFYGSGFNAYDISVANKIDPASPIEIGQKLIIPDVKRRQSTVGEISSISTSKITFTEGKYIVQPGDSLSLISQKVYGDLYLWPRILQANNLQNPDQIEVGMILTIPR